MAYHKLSQSLIKTIASKLNEHIRLCSRYAWVCPPWSVNIRVICKQVGISHTTFYRWMREARPLKYKRGLTEHQKLVRAFGQAVAAASRKLSAIPTTQSIPNQRIPMGRASIVDDTQTEATHTPLHETDIPNIEDIERRTTHLTTGIRGINAAIIDSLKNM